VLTSHARLSQGGPRRNQKCQVLTPSGDPIPRLYNAGELGSFWRCSRAPTPPDKVPGARAFGLSYTHLDSSAFGSGTGTFRNFQPPSLRAGPLAATLPASISNPS
jgi:hypothetical protein